MRALFIFLVITSISALGQDVVFPRPEFIDEPCLWNKTLDTLLRLEKHPILPEGRGTYTIPGITSPVQIAATSEYYFLLDHSNPELPSKLELYKVVAENAERHLTLTGPEQKRAQNLDVGVKRIGDNALQIIPSTHLDPGEYCFLIGLVSYSFSVQ